MLRRKHHTIAQSSIKHACTHTAGVCTYNDLQNDPLSDGLNNRTAVYHILQGAHPLADLVQGFGREGDGTLTSVQLEGVVACLLCFTLITHVNSTQAI